MIFFPSFLIKLWKCCHFTEEQHSFSLSVFFFIAHSHLVESIELLPLVCTLRAHRSLFYHSQHSDGASVEMVFVLFVFKILSNERWCKRGSFDVKKKIIFFFSFYTMRKMIFFCHIRGKSHFNYFYVSYTQMKFFFPFFFHADYKQHQYEFNANRSLDVLIASQWILIKNVCFYLCLCERVVLFCSILFCLSFGLRPKWIYYNEQVHLMIFTWIWMPLLIM